MANYKGIIAGIGDRLTGANAISPQFDARIYKFIIGHNRCILDGLEVDEEKKILKSGVCFLDGYRGYLNSDIAFGEFEYILGAFTVNHNSEILDSFSVITAFRFNNDGEYEAGDKVYDIDGALLSPSTIKAKVGDYLVNNRGELLKITSEEYEDGEPLNIFTAVSLDFAGNNLIYNAGTAYMTLYSKDKPYLVERVPFIANARYADNTNRINNNGTLGKNVTAPTQPINTNNKTIATTEFVRNQIEEDIGYKNSGEQVADFEYRAPGAFGGADIKIRLSYNIKRKAKLCVFNCLLTNLNVTSLSGNYEIPIGTIIATLNNDYKPKSQVSTENDMIGINANGEIYLLKVYRLPYSGATFSYQTNYGYETN